MMNQKDLTEAEKIARALDPDAWAAMTAAERRELVAKINGHAASEFSADNLLRRRIRSRRKS